MPWQPGGAGAASGIRRRHGPQDAYLSIEHDVGGGHAREQRDLGVPSLYWLGARKPSVQPSAVWLDLLLRDLQADSTAIMFPDLTPLAHQLQQAESLRGAYVLSISAWAWLDSSAGRGCGPWPVPRLPQPSDRDGPA